VLVRVTDVRVQRDGGRHAGSLSVNRRWIRSPVSAPKGVVNDRGATGAPCRLRDANSPAPNVVSFSRMLMARVRGVGSHVSLPLTAPGEERSREIRRIAVTYRRAGLLLWGIRVGLHHLPIKMPGGMTEHRQNNGEPYEER
jgi:hypothetical protein